LFPPGSLPSVSISSGEECDSAVLSSPSPRRRWRSRPVGAKGKEEFIDLRPPPPMAKIEFGANQKSNPPSGRTTFVCALSRRCESLPREFHTLFFSPIVVDVSNSGGEFVSCLKGEHGRKQPGEGQFPSTQGVLASFGPTWMHTRGKILCSARECVSKSPRGDGSKYGGERERGKEAIADSS